MDDLTIDEVVEDCFATGQGTPLMGGLIHPDYRMTPSQIRLLLDQHRDYTFINRPDPVTETTPLLQIVASPESEMPHANGLVAILLDPKYGVDVHARSGPNQSQPIFAAAELGKTEIVKMLLDRGADPMSTAPNIPTCPIGVAVAYNYYEIVAHLVKAAKRSGQLNDMLSTLNQFQQTAAQVGMMRRRTEIVGIMAREAGDLRNSFYAVWDEDPDMHLRFLFEYPDPENFPETGALYKTVYSFVSKTCCYCREAVSDAQKTCCSQCTMAWYCGAECQKSDWKKHKKCCKKLKRGVDLVLGTGRRNLVPYPLVKQTGFEEDFIESKYRIQAGHDYGYDYAWEYHGIEESDPAKRVWKKYPPSINRILECMCQLRGDSTFLDPRHKFSYVPNKPNLSTSGCEDAPFSAQPPPNVDTRVISLPIMMEFDIYTGAARAVRRVGEKPSLDAKMPEEMKQIIETMRDPNVW